MDKKPKVLKFSGGGSRKAVRVGITQTITFMVSPKDLSKKPSSVKIEIPKYDWEKQVRFTEKTVMAGRYTSGSIQTFDSKGKPYDSKSDNND